jgi:hypothetical protein
MGIKMHFLSFIFLFILGEQAMSKQRGGQFARDYVFLHDMNPLMYDSGYPQSWDIAKY